MRFKITFMLLLGIFLSNDIGAVHTGPFTSRIKLLQATDMGNAYTTLFVEVDITASPCADTNAHDRFAIRNNLQYSTLLTALSTNKEVTFWGDGVCNSADIDGISAVRIKP